MSAPDRIETVGWIFFGVVLALSTPICVYLMYEITHESVTHGTRIGSGVTLAFFVAAVLSFLVNSALQFRARRLDARAEAAAKSQRAEGRDHKQRK